MIHSKGLLQNLIGKQQPFFYFKRAEMRYINHDQVTTMANFTGFQDYSFLCSDISSEEKCKLNDYLRISKLMESSQHR